MSPEEIRKLCRPLPLRGELEVTETSHGFVRVAIHTHKPKWFMTAFAVWPRDTKARIKELYGMACKRHARGYTT